VNINKLYIYAALDAVVSVLSYFASGGSFTVAGLCACAIGAIGVIESELGHEAPTSP
jgi:hypothetical protein